MSAKAKGRTTKRSVGTFEPKTNLRGALLEMPAIHFSDMAGNYNGALFGGATDLRITGSFPALSVGETRRVLPRERQMRLLQKRLIRPHRGRPEAAL